MSRSVQRTSLWLVAILIFTLFSAYAPASAAVAICDGSSTQNTMKVTALHGQVVYVDTGVRPRLDAAYVSYRVTNTSATAREHIWVELSSFTGNSVKLANPLDGTTIIDELGGNSSETTYFLLQATTPTTTDQVHTVKIYDNRPDLGGTVLYTCNYTFTDVKDTIKAKSNKVISISASNTSPVLGELLSFTIEGKTGIVGQGDAPDGDIMWFSPSAYASWPTRALRLESISVLLDSDGNFSTTSDQGTYTNQLIIENVQSLTLGGPSNQVGANSRYRAQYNFRVIGSAPDGTKVVPIAQISSGRRIKHTDTLTTDTGPFPELTFDKVDTTININKSAEVVDPDSPTNFSTVKYTLDITTNSTDELLIDEIVDDADDGIDIVEGSVKYSDNRSPSLATTQDPEVDADGNNVFIGPYYVKSSNGAQIEYLAYIPRPTSETVYRNYAYGYIGDRLVGKSDAAIDGIKITSGPDGPVIDDDERTVGPTIATVTASDVTTTTAVMNALIDPNANFTAFGFQYSTNANMTSPTCVQTVGSGSQSSSQDEISYSYGLSGLSTDTTYYFRAVGNSDSSITVTDACSTPDLIGQTLNFTTTPQGLLSQTITWNTVFSNLTTSTPLTLTTAATATSGLPVILTPTNSDVCIVSEQPDLDNATAGYAVFTIVGPGTCELTATQDGNASYAAATPVVKSFTISGVNLNLTISGSGTVTSDIGNVNCSVSCTKSIRTNTSIVLTATPATGYVFTGWSGACSGSSTCSLTMDSTKSVTATFSPAPYTVDVTVSGNGEVSNTKTADTCESSCSIGVVYGDSLTLTATPKRGWEFTGWSGACSGTSTCAVTVDGSKSVTATFTKRTARVDVTTQGSGKVTNNYGNPDCRGNCSINAYELETITLVANADTGWEFTGWTGACTGTSSTCVISLEPQASSMTLSGESYTISSASLNQLIKSTEATFEITQEILSVVVTGNGSIGDTAAFVCTTSCSEEYDYNTSVTLTAVPDAGWEFTGWSGDCTGTGSCTITMDAAKSVTATFSQTTHTLYVTLMGSGSVSDGGSLSCISDCSDVYFEGDTVTLSATPDPSYFFAGWTGDCVGLHDCTITITEDTYVTAEFTLVPIVTNDLTINIVGNGSVGGDTTCESASCIEEFNESTSLTLIAIPDAGWEFTGWSGDCTGTGDCTLSMEVDRNVTATFSQIFHDLDITIVGNGSVDDSFILNCALTCSDSRAEGESVVLNASPDIGWQFSGWSGDCTGTGSCSLSMTSDKNVTATFTEIKYDLTINITGEGSIGGDYNCNADTCTESILENESVTLTATAASGWRFVEWTGDCLGTNPCAVTMDANRNVTAVFEQITHNLTITIIGNGGVSDGVTIDCANDCVEVLNEGDAITLTATPDTGWEFAGWSGACSGTETCSITMNETKSVTATFSQITFSLNIAISGSGEVTGDIGMLECISDCDSTFNYGDVITLTATPDDGFYFAGWSGDCSGTSTCTLTMLDNKNVTATFLLIPVITHLLTMTVVGNGSIGDDASISCTTYCIDTIVEDTVITLIATPDAGWEFTGWTGACSGTGTCTITMDSDKTVTATFELITIDLSMTVVGNGAIGGDFTCASGNCTEVTEENQSVTLSATAATGWEFTGWSGACSGTSTCTITMDSDKAVTATFTQITHSLSISIIGNGDVSDSGLVDCSVDCVETIADGNVITLTASPGADWYFVGWSGDCSETSTCTLTMDSDKSVTAEFMLIPIVMHDLTMDVLGEGTVSGSSVASGSKSKFNRSAVSIECRDECTTSILAGSTVMLTATPDAGWEFTGWSGACSGTETCSITMDGPKFVSANFAEIQTVSLTVKVNGSGTVIGDAISCRDECVFEIERDSIVNLAAMPDIDWTFQGWDGICAGTETCDISMSQSRVVIATFTPILVANPKTLSVKVIGMGAVKVNDVELCEDECTYFFAPGTEVSLSSITTDDWSFSHWDDVCENANCTLSMTSDMVLNVYFAPPAPAATYSPTLGKTKISWAEVPAPEGEELLYTVISKGKVLCQTVDLDCTVQKVLGPAHNLKIQTEMLAMKSPEGPISLNKGKLLITIRFDFDKANVKQRYKAKLKKVAKAFAKAGFTTYEIRGHTDSRGTESYNKLLSQFRALNVIREMRRYAKLSYKTTWYGERKPIASNKTVKGRKENRRTEVRIVL